MEKKQSYKKVQKLKKQRLKLGVSLRELGKIIGVSHTSISRMENYEKYFNQKLCEKVKYTLDNHDSEALVINPVLRDILDNTPPTLEQVNNELTTLERESVKLLKAENRSQILFLRKLIKYDVRQLKDIQMQKKSLVEQEKFRASTINFNTRKLYLLEEIYKLMNSHYGKPRKRN